MYRQFPDGTEERAPLDHGPDGFCVALLNGKVVESECPNWLVEAHAVVLKRPSGPTMKKPAVSIDSSDGESMRSMDADVCAPPPKATPKPTPKPSPKPAPTPASKPSAKKGVSKGSEKLADNVMRCKTTHCVAFRRQFSPCSQALQVGSWKCSRRQHEVLVEQAIGKLLSGEHEDGAKPWAGLHVAK